MPSNFDANAQLMTLDDRRCTHLGIEAVNIFEMGLAGHKSCIHRPLKIVRPYIVTRIGVHTLVRT